MMEGLQGAQAGGLSSCCSHTRCWAGAAQERSGVGAELQPRRGPGEVVAVSYYLGTFPRLPSPDLGLLPTGSLPPVSGGTWAGPGTPGRGGGRWNGL